MDLFLISMKPSRILLVLSIVALSLPNVFLFFTEQMPLLARICNVVLPVAVYAWGMTLNRQVGKAFLWFSPLLFFAAFQIVLLYLFGNSVIAVDMYLNLVTTNTTEVGELLRNIYPSIIFVVIVYLPLLVWSVYSLKNDYDDESFRMCIKRWAKRVFLLGVAMLVACYVMYKDYEIERNLYPVNVLYNVWLAVEREIKIKDYYHTSHDFTFEAESVHDANKDEIYVLVIGETARVANFGLYGYERNTTPLLGSRDDLIVFSNAFTQSNTTHKSVPMIMSAVSAENFEDIYFQKGIFTAFKEAGFNTAFFSNQRRNDSFIDFFGHEADEVIFIKDSLPDESNVCDERLLDLVERYLKKNNSGKRFIVLHTYGSHFEYSERYSSDKAYYKPDRCTNASPQMRDVLVNAYDNSIRATDELLYNLIEMIDAQGDVSAVMYVSDHGEDIYDDSRNLFLHASPIPSEYQLHVPLIVWTSEKYGTTYPNVSYNLMMNKDESVAANLAVFHTMLDMAGIASPYKKDDCALSSEDFEPSVERTYLDDHNRLVTNFKQ